MMEHSSFIRIYYSTHNIIFNGLFLHHPSLEDVLHIEKDILDSYISKKHPVYSIQKQYKHKHLKISGNGKNTITIKDIKLKDAIYYKEKNSYKVNYICTNCFYYW
jgi:hypothetical protein